MAGGNWTVYSNAVLGLTDGSFDLASDTLVCALLTNSYSHAVTVADANNTTPFICNVERALPSDMNPHC